MGLSNYPPGVSGNEWQIAGPEREDEGHRVCPNAYCDKEVLVTISFYGDETFWECPECGFEVVEEFYSEDDIYNEP